MNADSTDNSPDDSRPDPLTGGDYVRWGWHALSRDPFLPLFEACAALLTYLIAPIMFIGITGLAVTRVRKLVLGGTDTAEILQRAAADPTVWLAAIGIGIVVWLIQFAFSTAIAGGTRGAVGRAVKNQSIHPVGTFSAELPNAFPLMLGLRIYRGIAVGCAGLLALGVGVALAHSMMDPTGPGGWPLFAQSLWLAAPLTLAVAFAVLVRVGIDCAVGPIFCGDRSVPSGIADGVRFFLQRFGLVYRILAAGAVVLLVPLVGIWLFSLIGIFIPTSGPLGTLGLVLRLFAQGLLIMAIPIAGLLISSALMAAWHHLEDGGQPPTRIAEPT